MGYRKISEKRNCFGCCRHFLHSDPDCHIGICCSHPPSPTGTPMQESLIRSEPRNPPFGSSNLNTDEDYPQTMELSGGMSRSQAEETSELQDLKLQVATLTKRMATYETILQEHQESCNQIAKALRLKRKLNKCLDRIVRIYGCSHLLAKSEC